MFNDSIRAYESLKNKYSVTYVPTKHNSDELNNFHYMRTETNDHDARDATITLNMFKIKKDPILRDMVSSENNNDNFFNMVPHQPDEVENLYAPVESDFLPLRKSLEPSDFQVCQTNATHEEETHKF